jgi:hypothetical protein
MVDMVDNGGELNAVHYPAGRTQLANGGWKKALTDR